ncbi:TetR/AcrR family transcriptional regulator [Amorphus coralli]|uniref:TetR/AcrR family transcriptional regulator n=1 Tax=Amorphus coralli TaxID=340680 RepID=UPI00037C4925|nr:TetR/AcrR family transcriptional regulator [Amorphus coralli]
MLAASTRDQIITEADTLFYESGFEATSFSDIASAVGISRGNFYYHFKSKDEILDAVIARRLVSTREMLERWEAETTDPRERIMSFFRILLVNRTKIMAFGCPVGTLCAELAKLDHMARGRAEDILALFRDWLEGQFRALGHGEDEANDFALHVLMRSQGLAILASAFRDADYVRKEVDDLADWLDRLPAPGGQTSTRR